MDARPAPSRPDEPPSDEPPSDVALSADELERLVARVFRPTPDDRRLLVITDLPDPALPDRPRWAARRALALDWARKLDAVADRTGLAVSLALYRNVRANNADLPDSAWTFPLDGDALARDLPLDADMLDPAAATPFAHLFESTDIVIAPTELSTTAPLKLAARRHGLRAATMPGFTAAMIPALRLDYGEIDRRVRLLKALLDPAHGATLRFVVDGSEAMRLFLDLRHRTAHASGGLVTERGTAGNLPSGEAYIVPYEGEHSGDPSRTEGVLPVEWDGAVVRYRVAANRAVEAIGDSAVAANEARRLEDEPAYGNIAELGLGVVAAFGVEPIGAVLLDEKLGPHVAFGRSDHFGGQVSPADFTRPENVVHIDRVYLPETQPRIALTAIDLQAADGSQRAIWRNGDYVPGLFAS